MTRDPVCGMQVDEKTAPAQVEYEGTIYYFCSGGCKKRFEEDPRKFVTGSRAEWDRP